MAYPKIDNLATIGVLGIIVNKDDWKADSVSVVMDHRYSDVPVDLRITMLQGWVRLLQKHLADCEFEQAMEGEE